LGSCSDFEFTYAPLQGEVSYFDSETYSSETDDWLGEWVRLFVNDGRILHCAIDGWIDGNNLQQPFSRTFDCFPCSDNCSAPEPTLTEGT
jgi:hypothetical protein